MLTHAGEFGWPASVALPVIPETDDEKTSLIDTLQEWKTQKYQDMIGEIPVPPRQSKADYISMI